MIEIARLAGSNRFLCRIVSLVIPELHHPREARSASNARRKSLDITVLYRVLFSYLERSVAEYESLFGQ